VKDEFMEIKILSIHGSGLKKEVKFRPTLRTQNKTNRNKTSCQDLIAGNLKKIFLLDFPLNKKTRAMVKNNTTGLRRFPTLATCPGGNPPMGFLLLACGRY